MTQTTIEPGARAQAAARRAARHLLRRRVAAVAALVFGVLALAAALYAVVVEFPLVLVYLVGLAGGGACAWFAVRRRGVMRSSGLLLAVLFLAGIVAFVVSRGHVIENVTLVVSTVLAVGATRVAYAIHVPLPWVAPPAKPVLFWNPRSGGGKAEQFDLPAEARRRGIRPVELTPRADLRALVEEAVADGADGLAMAGGDGSQAVVAGLAAGHDLPYACIPAGTRNHFALDLGVDRDDVVGALDAFVDGGERRVDLGCVNDEVFVNNVSLGLYAESVQRDGYRDAKLRTILDTVPDVIGRDARPRLDLQWTGPHGGEHESAAVILVSNNVYVLTGLVGAGTRPSIDDGLLGITVIGETPAAATAEPEGEPGALALLQPPWRQWAARTFEVASADEVPAGMDGEAVTLTSPVCFRALPGVLRVRIAPQHPGASPSAALPSGARDTVRTLVHIAGRRR